MKYLQKMTDYFSKNADLKYNDSLAKMYDDKIYEDYDLNKDLKRVLITNEHISYLISDAANGNAYSNIMYANPLINDIEIKIYHDYFECKINLSEFGDIKLPIVARDMKTKKTIFDKNGIEQEDVYSGIKVSKNFFEELHTFFKNEYITKYPYMRGNEYFNASKIKQNKKNYKELGTDYIDYE